MSTELLSGLQLGHLSLLCFGIHSVLTGYLEGGASADMFPTVRQKVLDKVAYCKQRRQVLLDHVKEVFIHLFYIVERH